MLEGGIAFARPANVGAYGRLSVSTIACVKRAGRCDGLAAGRWPLVGGRASARQRQISKCPVVGHGRCAPAVSCSNAAVLSRTLTAVRPWSRSLRARGADAVNEGAAAARCTADVEGQRPSARPGTAIGRSVVQQTLAARQGDPGWCDPCLHRRERLTLRYVPQSLPFRTGPTAVHDCRTLVANGGQQSNIFPEVPSVRLAAMFVL